MAVVFNNNNNNILLMPDKKSPVKLCDIKSFMRMDMPQMDSNDDYVTSSPNPAQLLKTTATIKQENNNCDVIQHQTEQCNSPLDESGIESSGEDNKGSPEAFSNPASINNQLADLEDIDKTIQEETDSGGYSSSSSQHINNLSDIDETIQQLSQQENFNSVLASTNHISGHHAGNQVVPSVGDYNYDGSTSPTEMKTCDTYSHTNIINDNVLSNKEHIQQQLIFTQQPPQLKHEQVLSPTSHHHNNLTSSPSQYKPNHQKTTTKTSASNNNNNNQSKNTINERQFAGLNFNVEKEHSDLFHHFKLPKDKSERQKAKSMKAGGAASILHGALLGRIKCEQQDSNVCDSANNNMSLWTNIKDQLSPPVYMQPVVSPEPPYLNTAPTTPLQHPILSPLSLPPPPQSPSYVHITPPLSKSAPTTPQKSPASSEEFYEGEETEEEEGSSGSNSAVSSPVGTNSKEGSGYPCRHCGKVYNSYQYRWCHEKAHVLPKNHRCEICGSTFQYLQNLSRHIRQVHKTARPFKCKECGRCCNNEEELEKHIINTHQNNNDKVKQKETIICPVCGVEYSKKYYVRVHKKFHKGIRYSCQICGRVFTHPQNMWRHYKLHENNESYKIPCSQCPMFFKSEMTLKRHVDAKHSTDQSQLTDTTHDHPLKHPNSPSPTASAPATPGKTFDCQVCQKIFASKSALYCHMRVHQKNKSVRNYTLQCSVCKKCYKEWGALKKHCETNHGGEGLVENQLSTSGDSTAPYKQILQSELDLLQSSNIEPSQHVQHIIEYASKTPNPQTTNQFSNMLLDNNTPSTQLAMNIANQLLSNGITASTEAASYTNNHNQYQQINNMLSPIPQDIPADPYSPPTVTGSIVHYTTGGTTQVMSSLPTTAFSTMPSTSQLVGQPQVMSNIQNYNTVDVNSFVSPAAGNVNSVSATGIVGSNLSQQLQQFQNVNGVSASSTGIVGSNLSEQLQQFQNIYSQQHQQEQIQNINTVNSNIVATNIPQPQEPVTIQTYLKQLLQASQNGDSVNVLSIPQPNNLVNSNQESNNINNINSVPTASFTQMLSPNMTSSLSNQIVASENNQYTNTLMTSPAPGSYTSSGMSSPGPPSYQQHMESVTPCKQEPASPAPSATTGTPGSDRKRKAGRPKGSKNKKRAYIGEESYFQCQYCEALFKSRGGIQKHERLHLELQTNGKVPGKPRKYTSAVSEGATTENATVVHPASIIPSQTQIVSETSHMSLPSVHSIIANNQSVNQQQPQHMLQQPPPPQQIMQAATANIDTKQGILPAVNNMIYSTNINNIQQNVPTLKTEDSNSSTEQLPESYNCVHCGSVFTNPRLFQQHITLHIQQLLLIKMHQQQKKEDEIAGVAVAAAAASTSSNTVDNIMVLNNHNSQGVHEVLQTAPKLFQALTNNGNQFNANVSPQISQAVYSVGNTIKTEYRTAVTPTTNNAFIQQDNSELMAAIANFDHFGHVNNGSSDVKPVIASIMDMVDIQPEPMDSDAYGLSSGIGHPFEAMIQNAANYQTGLLHNTAGTNENDFILLKTEHNIDGKAPVDTDILPKVEKQEIDLALLMAESIADEDMMAETGL